MREEKKYVALYKLFVQSPKHDPSLAPAWNINPSSTIPVYVLDPDCVIDVLADGLAPIGARPFACKSQTTE